MSEIEQTKNKKAQRLGRGLGSLFSGSTMEPVMSESPSVDSNPKASNPVPQQQAVQAKGKEAEPPSGPSNDASLSAESAVREELRIWIVAIDKVKPNKEQPRKEFSSEELKDLAASIKQKGIIQPITVRKDLSGDFEIIAGERRWRAAQMAGLHEVPVIIKRMDRQSQLEVALIENIQRQDLNPIEESEAYQHLMAKYHLTQQQVADRVGKERATVANSLRLLLLSPEVREFVKNGELSIGHAKVILSLPDHSTQKKVAKKAINLRLSVRATEKLVQGAKESQQESKDSQIDSLAEKLAGGTAQELQKILGRKVAIDYKQGKGKIAISFYSDEELSELIERFKTSWK